MEYRLQHYVFEAWARLAAGGMAILIQTLVPADAAGVAFTANPVTGDHDETAISAVRGLGERLVSGGATADEWVVRDGHAICLAHAEDGSVYARWGGQALPSEFFVDRTGHVIGQHAYVLADFAEPEASSIA